MPAVAAFDWLPLSEHSLIPGKKVQPCHAERSEASGCCSRQTLRCAQGDRV